MTTRDLVNDVLRSTTWKRMSRWVRGGKAPAAAAGHEIDGVQVPAEVVVYFGDGPEKIYQVQQWLPVLERLHERHPVLLVFRKVGALRAARSMTRLPKVFVRRFEDLMSLYDENSYRLGLYVNNGVTNFQALNQAAMVHVHVNHGESDKISMVANQAKGYDKVFVAGPAALARHERVLFDFDMNHLQVVGRPQLDIDFPPELEPITGVRTVMYAPTWSGENDANNYTSVDLYGTAIVDTLLSVGATRVIYKPHPRIADAKDPMVKAAHEHIVDSLDRASQDGNLEHEVRMDGNILAMFDAVDALITDVSSVGLDFLYLHPDKPLVLTDRRTDRELLHMESPVSRGCAVIDEDSIGALEQLLRDALREDSFQEARAAARRFYFGNISRGQSTQLFTQAIERLLSERAEAIAERRQIYGEQPPSPGE